MTTFPMRPRDPDALAVSGRYGAEDHSPPKRLSARYWLDEATFIRTGETRRNQSFPTRETGGFVEVRFRLGGKPPIVARVVEEFREADRDVDPHRIVNRPGLQQQNLRAGIFGEPVSKHAAGRAGTNDDVVVVGHASLPLCLRPAKRIRGFSLLGRDYRQDDMRKAGRLREAAVASVARLYFSVRSTSPDRACRGAPERTRCACVLKQPGPRKAAMEIGLIAVC